MVNFFPSSPYLPLSPLSFNPPPLNTSLSSDQKGKERISEAFSGFIFICSSQTLYGCCGLAGEAGEWQRVAWKSRLLFPSPKFPIQTISSLPGYLERLLGLVVDLGLYPGTYCGRRVLPERLKGNVVGGGEVPGCLWKLLWRGALRMNLFVVRQY